MTLRFYEQHEAMGELSCLSVAASGNEKGMHMRLPCAAWFDGSRLFRTSGEMYVI